MLPTPIIIGLAGGTGSGKTTVAQVILSRVGAQHIAYVPHGAYYHSFSDLPKAQRDQINWDHPDSLETDLMVEHVKALKAGQAVDLPVYDFTTRAPPGQSTSNRSRSSWWRVSSSSPTRSCVGCST